MGVSFVDMVRGWVLDSGRSRTPAMATLLMAFMVCEGKLDCGASAAGEYLCDDSYLGSLSRRVRMRVGRRSHRDREGIARRFYTLRGLIRKPKISS